MQINNVQRVHKNKTKKRIGRGGLRGKTSGRGHKGQKAHGGHGIRPEMRDTIKKLPKKRGYRFRSIQTKPYVVNLGALDVAFEAGDDVSPKTLSLKKLIRNKKGKRIPVKILATGKITKKLSITGCSVSDKAREHIEKAGGMIENKGTSQL
ncbi:uL15 family ribosomal protein [Patescibacteria group bacterium]|nr:uL15 family ribosomal protein [Patescibacteria group bacterium]